MPRTARASVGGICYHVINRGNAQNTVFLDEDDYQTFLDTMADACAVVAMPVLGYCLMPNHFHLVVRPPKDGDLSRWMHRLLNTHVRRYHQQHGSSGHLWQGRFKAFPIQEDAHLLTVLRYIERNPVRGKLVRRAEKWPWSSAPCWKTGADKPSFLAVGPVKRPRNWLDKVNQALVAADLALLRRSVNRGTPFGDEEWVARTAKKLGLLSTMRPRGRPRKLS